MESFESVRLSSREAQLDQLVEANCILVDRGVLDAFGHVSVRAEDDTSSFLISRNLAPALVQASDVQTLSFAGTTEDPRPTYLEIFIHSEIYRARPDVRAIVHSHSAAVIPFGVSTVALRPVLHMAGFLAPAAPVFEIRHFAGPATDLLIRSPDLGAALAASLREACVVLMRGHGATAVGTSLPEAVYRAIYTEVNARAQLAATSLGQPTFLTDDEAAATVAAVAPQMIRAWNYWRNELRRRE